MNFSFKLSFFFLFIAIASGSVFAQSQKPACPEFQKKAGEDNSGFYAVVRYVIVYNDVGFTAGPKRRLQVLINPEQFNEENLRCVFTLINKQFPTPEFRTIQVHTNLATIQTPEEIELWQGSDDPRFSDLREKYKTAYYIRYEGGREVFEFTTQLEPTYETKTVVLVDKSVF